MFCRGCLRHYLENSVFGTGRAQLKCLAPMDPACTGVIPESCIQRSLPSKARHTHEFQSIVVYVLYLILCMYGA